MLETFLVLAGILVIGIGIGFILGTATEERWQETRAGTDDGTDDVRLEALAEEIVEWQDSYFELLSNVSGTPCGVCGLPMVADFREVPEGVRVCRGHVFDYATQGLD